MKLSSAKPVVEPPEHSGHPDSEDYRMSHKRRKILPEALASCLYPILA